jgi:serine/threonine protein kinase
MLEELAPQGALDNFWEKWHFIRLSFESSLDLSRNIAEGLLALHNCGVVHGDIKPENILVFPRRDADNSFIAKLTDFGHSVFEHSRLNTLPAFTPKWCAPELTPEGSMSKRMEFKEMKATDFYSYGLVVLSIMIGRPFHKSLDNIEASKLDETMLKRGIALVNKEDRENHDSDLDLSVVQALLRRIVRLNPAHRDLKQCIKIMDRQVVYIPNSQAD